MSSTSSTVYKLLLTLSTLLVLSLTFSTAVVNAQQSTCVQTPWATGCTDFVYPAVNVSQDIDNLCDPDGGMPYMAVCSINNTCSQKAINSGVCQPLSVLADGCQFDMPGMSGCSNYKSMCGVANSTVAECKTYQAIPNLISTKQLNLMVYNICHEMNMESCSKCPWQTTPPGTYLDCDLLLVYSQLCQQMPTMGQCQQWKTFCAQGTALEKSPLSSTYCSQPEGQKVPLMRMYFHTGILDYVLFKDWVPQNNGQYTGYWFLVFFFAILFECEKTLRAMLEKKWEAVRQKNLEINGEEVSSLGGIRGSFPPFNIKVDVVRGFLTGVELTMSYLLMLVAMTFNVALFFSVIAGTIVGNILVGRFRSYKPKVTCCD
ncbi:hypothetical protein SAMD00019534_126550 [Acytostelium subglobosum LB1]|uniref:hypothetical protein n=1 Tax=Acytostelium subglobosum LB1 TaxID=1410327 RepID=UPI0006450CAE|nr:hypothetical protein SAMD00019534_126550 [Acytostelium subglobosum LB1]GAM29479.1 hypothetical protein SAMD00019534_126550 [Acytostelium subglobosum LB1]|eukprot:XP_012747574.1 hypothetical protein SAMD00019534_126550 [Acytostelium subglobosum LB1]